METLTLLPSVEEWDCVVIGAGPAGTTVANLLAQHGHRVCVVERALFPREHIGESLLPGVLPLLHELKALKRVEDFGFEVKLGQTFRWNPNEAPWDLIFDELDRFSYSYFVKRSEFDLILMDVAREQGATIYQETAVDDVLFEGDRAVGVHVRGAAGETREIRAQFVVDASGSAAILARRLRLRRFTETMKSFAMWAYFEGHPKPEGLRRNTFLTATWEHGWIWVIPLHDGTVSVGVVMSRDAVPKGLKGKAREVWFEDVIRREAVVSDRLGDAHRVTPIKSARDWSYRCKQRSGPGWALVGEAAGFIDPLLSYGVHFAMNTGFLAAIAIHNSLKEPRMRDPSFLYFETASRSLYENLFWAVENFYSYAADRESVFWRQKSLVGRNSGHTPYQAFVYVTSGIMANQAFGGRSDHATLEVEARRDPKEMARRLKVVSEARPGEFQPDLLIGGEGYIVARSVIATNAAGEPETFDLLRRGFELSLAEPAPPEAVAPEPVFRAEFHASLCGAHHLLRLEALPSAAGGPSYRKTERLSVIYTLEPQDNTPEIHRALLEALEEIMAHIDVLEAENSPLSGFGDALVARISSAPGGAGTLVPVQRPSIPTDDGVFSALILDFRDDTRLDEPVWFFIEPRSYTDTASWLQTAAFGLSYRPSHLKNGVSLFDDPSCRSLCNVVAAFLGRFDDRNGLDLASLAEGLAGDADDPVWRSWATPAPWHLHRVEGILRSGSPKVLWAREAEPTNH